MNPDVIVVGGGFAGLSAGAALAERGARVLLLEARPALGGRAAAFTDPATGERVDNGQHVLIGCYHETFRFLRRIGSEAAVRLQPNLRVDVVARDGSMSRLRCPSLPAPLHLLAGLVGWDALDWRDVRAATRIVRGGRIQPARHEGPAKAGPHVQTVREFLAGAGQTPRLIELLWEPLAVAALNQSIDEAAAAPFVEVLRRMFTTRRMDSSLGLPVKPLDEMYANPARMFIEARGGEVRTSTVARVQTSPGVAVVTGNDTFHPRAVICATAWHALPALLPDPPRSLAPIVAAAEATGASAILTVNLWLDRPLTGAAFVGMPGRAMQWVFDKRALFGEAGSHLSLTSSGAGALIGRSNEDLIALASHELREALPPARDALVRRGVVVRERRATFSHAPGQPQRPGTRTAVPGILLAGDWIDTGLPATIESAVVSGHRAAEAALELIS